MQALTRAAEGLSGSCRDAGRRDKDQAQVRRADAPQELPNRRPTSLRNGAENVSASGLKLQDNDLIMIESAEAAAAFKRASETRFASGELLSAGVKQ